MAVAGNELTIRASGADIWNNVDGHSFLAVPVAGDFQFTIKLNSKPAHEVAGGDNFAKVGAQIKFGLNPGDLYAYAFASVERSPIFMVEGRKVFGGGNNYGGGKVDFPGTFPAWLRLIRKGSIITASFSTNGTTFEDLRDGEDYGYIPPVVYVGIAATAHRDGAYVVGKIDTTAIKFEPAP